LKSFARLKDVSLGELALKGLDADISFRPWLLDGNNKAHIQHVHWRALKQLLLERPWFRRTWVYQEIVMATKAIIICGTHIIDWDILYATCDTIDALNIYTGGRRGGKDPSHIVERILSMEDKRKALLRLLRRLETELRDCVSNDLAFEGLLCDFHSAEVTGPQDKVYALLAVAGVDETLLKPDYFSPFANSILTLHGICWQEMDIPPCNVSATFKRWMKFMTSS
jgi:hypothetical protein